MAMTRFSLEKTQLLHFNSCSLFCMLSLKSLHGYWGNETQHSLDLFKNTSRVMSYSLRMVKQIILHYAMGCLTHLVKLETSLQSPTYRFPKQTSSGNKLHSSLKFIREDDQNTYGRFILLQQNTKKA